MAIARTGVYVDDYLEYSSSLPADLQRLLSTMRELDERSQSMLGQLREQVKGCLMLPSKKKEGLEPDETLEKMRQQIETNQSNTVRLCTEKVLLAQQAFDLIDSHVRRLDEDLNSFAEDLKQEGKLQPDEPAILPLAMGRDEKRKGHFLTPLAKRLESRIDRDRDRDKERDRERDRDRDSELMPPPGSHKKKSLPAPTDIDQPVDPNEPTYCTCHQPGILERAVQKSQEGVYMKNRQTRHVLFCHGLTGKVSFGDMIACDNENCEGGEWFHYQCVGLSSETRFKGKWYCPTCKALQRRGLLEPPL